jgi:hypothetical protein
MTPKEQEKFVLDYIKKWVSSEEEAKKWYQENHIPSLNMTAQEAVKKGKFNVVKEYLEHINLGGFA